MTILRSLMMILILVVVSVATATVSPTIPPASAQQDQGPLACKPTVHQHGCSVFLAADNQMVLGGNNEDWRNPLTKLWFVPASEGTFGQMYVGFDNFFPQGGMNDQGLFFDGLAVEPTIVPPDNDLPEFPGNILNAALATCATVQCVIDLFSQYDRSIMVGAQLFFGDANGDAVIIEPVEFIHKQGRFLVTTNFYQSSTPPGQETCERYKTAQAMLSEAGTFNMDLFRNVLDAVHQGGDYPTQYSNIYDLKARVMYLYYFHDFDHVVQIDLADELAQGEHVYDIGALFPENRIAASWRAIRQRDFEVKLKRLGFSPDVDTIRFDSYTGRYAVPQELVDAGAVSSSYIEVDMADGLLTYDMPGDFMPPLPLYPTSETTFISSSYDTGIVLFSVEVLFDDAGQVSAIQGTFGQTPIIFQRLS